MSDVFDPNNLSISNGNYFALPHSVEESELVILSIPWDVTVSYNDGAVNGPDSIIDASEQIDLYDIHNPNGYTRGIATLPIDESLMIKSTFLRRSALKVIEYQTNGGLPCDDVIAKRLKRVNDGSVEMNEYVYAEAKQWIESKKIVCLVGGDHSTPYGLIKAVGELCGDFGILHIDAHADLRDAYEGFAFSHASIMFNVLRDVPQLSKLVQVGIRDFCDDEMSIIANNSKVDAFFDNTISERLFCGDSWKVICGDIVSKLPQKVYISFDIDGLSPEYCPSTGTPVPGGLSYAQAVFLLSEVVDSGREIVGFDLCEVSPHPSRESEWDANVGARILYKMCNLTLKSTK